jgi:hypothetical protein
VARPMPRADAAPVMTAVRSLGNGLSAFIGLLPSGREDGQVAQPPWQGEQWSGQGDQTTHHFPEDGVRRP